MLFVYFLIISKAYAASEFDGIVKLPGCSASIVRFTNNLKEKALVLSNGHCVSQEGPNTFSINKKPINRNLIAYSNENREVPITASRLIYATMTGADLGLVELEQTYEDLQTKGVHSFELASAPASIGAKVRMISGFFKTVENCSINSISPELREEQFRWKDSYGYEGCKSIKNTSGSPLVGSATNKIIGLNNTRNLKGERCTLDNPCEVESAGKVQVFTGRSYGQQVYPLLACVDNDGRFNLAQEKCALFGHKQ